MVVVVVRDQHRVDRRQVLEAQAGRHEAARARERHGAGPPRPDGIGQQIHAVELEEEGGVADPDRKSTRLNSSHGYISYAVFCLKKKKKEQTSCTRSIVTSS